VNHDEIIADSIARMKQAPTTNGGRQRLQATLATEPRVAAKLNLRDLRDIRFERVTWFEANMIPRAELTLVNGDGGIGKTTAVLDLIARSSGNGRQDLTPWRHRGFDPPS